MSSTSVEPLRLVQTRKQRVADDASDPNAVATLIDDWDDEVLACRSGNHVFMASRVDDARAFWVITERCARCKKVTREWDMDPRTGEQFGDKRLRYEEGYLAKGVGRIGGQGRNMIRLASVKRNMPKPRKMKPAEMQALHPHKATREALGITG